MNGLNRKIELPLYSLDGKQLHFRLTEDIADMVQIINNMSIPDWDGSLFDTLLTLEALNSSKVEGHSCTLENLNKFKNGVRNPSNKDEKAVFGNYKALQHGISNSNSLYTKELLLELNNLITGGSSNDYRMEPVVVSNKKGDIVHEGLPFDLLDNYLDKLMLFTEISDLEPLIVSCITHMYLVYVHPFLDGNGRTVRAYTYSYLMCRGSNKLVSISFILSSKCEKYYREILNVENNDYDLTEFITFMLYAMYDGLNCIKEIHINNQMLKDIKLTFNLNGIPFSNLTEDVINFILDKDNFTIDNFYKKNKSKYNKLGLARSEVIECTTKVLNRLIEFDFIDEDFKIKFI